jgi:hypothetical protein
MGLGFGKLLCTHPGLYIYSENKGNNLSEYMKENEHGVIIRRGRFHIICA